MFSARAGFFWLIDAGDDWYRAKVLDDWPLWQGNGAHEATLGHLSYTRTSEYPARVQFAAGAFNWRVQAGDSVRVIEFEHGVSTLSAELSGDELTWSQSTPVAHDQLKVWFGAALRSSGPAVRRKSASGISAPVKFMWWLVGLNFIPLMFEFYKTAIILVVAIIALLYPPAAFSNDDEEPT